MNILPILRIIFCILLIIIWFVWLVNLPEVEKQKSRKAKIQHSYINPQRQVDPPGDNQPPVKSQELITKSQKLIAKKIDLPKLVDLNIKDGGQGLKEKNTDLPIYKIAISPAQMPLSIQTIADDLKLRKRILLNHKNKPLLATSLLLKKDNEEWTPKYFAAKNDIKTKIKTLEENLNKIINQIELVEIIENKNGNVAIIKNNLTDKTHILKIGQEYLQLKVLEVKKDEIVFGNESVNKTFRISIRPGFDS